MADAQRKRQRFLDNKIVDLCVDCIPLFGRQRVISTVSALLLNLAIPKIDSSRTGSLATSTESRKVIIATK